MAEYLDKITLDGDTLTWALIGDAGVANTRELDNSVAKLGAHRATTLIIDLSQCTFVSSLAMGAMLSVQKALKPKGLQEIRIRHASPDIREALQRARLDSLMTLEA